MEISYNERLDLQPLPVNVATATILSRVLQKKVTAEGGHAKAATKVADVIIARLSDDSPSELARLQRLYAQVYTRAELELLALNTFDALRLEE